MTLNETITHICLTVNLPVLGTPGTFNNNYRWVMTKQLLPIVSEN